MSSYAGPFRELSPSDQADIASFSEPKPCRFCRGTGWVPSTYSSGPQPCGCEEAAELLETLAEQETHQ